MRRAQVFISHSTKTELAEAYLSALRKALNAPGRVKEYWLDRKNLEPGDKWRAQIYQALRESDAAILLLTKEAVEQSYFVQIEASYLSVQGTKLIIPILVDVKPEELDQGMWRALQINATQAIQNCDPKEAARRALVRLKDLKLPDDVWAENPRQRLRNRIACDLERAQVSFQDVRALRKEVKELTVTGKRAFPKEEDAARARMWLSEALLQHGPSASVENALRALRELRPENAEKLKGIVNRLTPHWVDENTANAMGHIATGDPSKRQFGIDIQNDWTLAAYACRARGCSLGEQPLQLSIPPIEREREAASVEAEAESIATFVAKQLDLAADDEERKEYFRQEEEAREWPILLSLDAKWWPPNGTLAAAIRKRLDRVALCFKVAKGNHDDPDISWLSAAVEPSEYAVSVRYKRLVRVLAT